MCGIAGFMTEPGPSQRQLGLIAGRMSESLAHRGPDDSGVWTDPAVAIAFGHRRLSIVDLSPMGHQPMRSACGRWVICYNGEVYNFRELRQELEAAGHTFRGSSDTEVIVQGCSQWGVEKTVRRLIGMFAFAAWDRRDRVLHLVRDRLGKKPLYWSHNERTLVFGSELKALEQYPGSVGDIDRTALTAYFRFGYIPAPRSIYTRVKKLEPGRILTISPSGHPQITRYWSAADAIGRGAGQVRSSDRETVDEFEALLQDAVSRRMVADVPVGAFLSGGVDSSTVVALMQKHAAGSVRTFSIGFSEAGFDEAGYARRVAAHLGTDHTELYVNAGDAAGVIKRLPMIYDEPFADQSQIPTCLLSELTRRSVTVSLSGDGGDELFAGYDRYHVGRLISRAFSMPPALRQALADLIFSMSPAKWDSVFSLVPGKVRPPAAGDKLHKLAAMLGGPRNRVYELLVGHWRNPGSLVLGGGDEVSSAPDEAETLLPGDPLGQMQYRDMITYLPDDILTKLDRASMAASLEARVPLLDHRVVEFAWGLPLRYKLRGRQTKWLLREVLYRYVPRHLIDRPKMGFGVPLDDWLRGPLREWAEDLLDPSRLRRDGNLNGEPIAFRLREHMSGRRNFQILLWDALMFQAWFESRRTPATKIQAA